MELFVTAGIASLGYMVMPNKKSEETSNNIFNSNIINRIREKEKEKIMENKSNFLQGDTNLVETGTVEPIYNKVD